MLQNEMEKSYDTGVAGDDRRERREEMERMREHIYKVPRYIHCGHYLPDYLISVNNVIIIIINTIIIIIIII